MNSINTSLGDNLQMDLIENGIKLLLEQAREFDEQFRFKIASVTVEKMAKEGF